MRLLSEMVYAVAERLITDEHVQWVCIYLFNKIFEIILNRRFLFQLDNLLSNKILDDYEDVKTKASVLASVNNYWQENFQSKVTDIFPSTLSSTDTPSSSLSTTPTETVTTTEQYSTTESSGGRVSISLSFFFIMTLVTINFN